MDSPNLLTIEGVLENTPAAIAAMTRGVAEDFLRRNEGPSTWSPFDVVGHLNHGERTDWIPRARKILSEADKGFVPFQREAMFERSKGKSFADLMSEFEGLRRENLRILKSWKLSDAELALTGIHPELGAVTLHQLLATWAVHDLGHLAQICRVLAKQWKQDIGPWQAYLSIVHWQGSGNKQ